MAPPLGLVCSPLLSLAPTTPTTRGDEGVSLKSAQHFWSFFFYPDPDRVGGVVDLLTNNKMSTLLVE